jgi:prepilin-type N-terminal cleavage/methylation domain-containing protein
MAINSLSLTSTNPQRQAGYTLIELSITLSIIAVLLVGTLTGVQRLLEANNTNNAIATTQAAFSNITKLQKATNTTGAAIYDTKILADLGVWDAALVTRTTVGTVTTASVKNPYNGAITVWTNSQAVGTASASTGYWYRIAGVPKGACASLATSFTNSVEGIYITATPVNATTTTGTVYKTPGSVDSTSNLATGCALGTAPTVEVSLFQLS